MLSLLGQPGHRRHRFAGFKFHYLIKVVGRGGQHHAFVGEFDAACADPFHR